MLLENMRTNHAYEIREISRWLGIEARICGREVTPPYVWLLLALSDSKIFKTGPLTCSVLHYVRACSEMKNQSLPYCMGKLFKIDGRKK